VDELAKLNPDEQLIVKFTKNAVRFMVHKFCIDFELAYNVSVSICFIFTTFFCHRHTDTQTILVATAESYPSSAFNVSPNMSVFFFQLFIFTGCCLLFTEIGFGTSTTFYRFDVCSSTAVGNWLKVDNLLS